MGRNRFLMCTLGVGCTGQGTAFLHATVLPAGMLFYTVIRATTSDHTVLCVLMLQLQKNASKTTTGMHYHARAL